MTENPYNPEWVQIGSDQEDSLWEGMQVAIEGGEAERVVAIRSYDVDVDGDGYGNVTATAVKVDEDGEWWHLHEVEFLLHELEWGKARFEARALIRRLTTTVRLVNGEVRMGGRGSMNYLLPRGLVIRQYDAHARLITGPNQPHFPF